MRRAIVTSSDSREVVANYLPTNYSAYEQDGTVVIIGEDDHGWTLDGYVIPRLASGLIAAVECNSYKAEVRTSGDVSWSGNGLRFRTEEAAERYVRDLMMRWTAVTDTRVVPSADPIGETQEERL